jgi:hypothetical protein
MKEERDAATNRPNNEHARFWMIYSAKREVWESFLPPSTHGTRTSCKERSIRSDIPFLSDVAERWMNAETRCGGVEGVNCLVKRSKQKEITPQYVQGYA